MKTLPMCETDSVNNSVLGGKNSSKTKQNQQQKTPQNKTKNLHHKKQNTQNPNFKDFQWLFFFHGTLY